MSTKKKNDSDYKQLEKQFNVLADCLDKIDNNNAREFSDLQTRVHKLESGSVSEKQAELEDKKFWSKFWAFIVGFTFINTFLLFDIYFVFRLLGLF